MTNSIDAALLTLWPPSLWTGRTTQVHQGLGQVVVPVLAYFGFFKIIYFCSQGDKPRRSQVRNLFVRKLLTRFLCLTTSWLCDDMLSVVSLSQVSHHTKPQVTCLCPCITLVNGPGCKLASSVQTLLR